MKKWLYLLLIAGVLVGCGQQEDGVSSNEPMNDENEENVLEEKSTDSDVKAEISEETEEAVEKESDQEMATTSQDTESEDESQQTEHSTQEQSVDEQEIDIEFIKNELKIGMTEQEVKSLLGEPSKTGSDAKNADPLWLYNIRPAKGYYFEGPFENPEIIDAVDTEGLKNREVDIILFLSWKEGEVDYISANYTNDNGDVKGYRLFEDGTIKES
ncbi:hypothetical protein J416_14273 [Gracilibacillus halophilus YIM-C55.5]|uniref:Uncharacterized protein n=1 Tax=Gracilibacillus halophilus YIM-C55.5 TaxID=1308866 RepID=N4W6C8_9BACI|nr:hypothetical protein [Gracilibacillus halophilus]ENH95768.1 hypothetical protein J416_14273 [Gracilibacillus halophilus YIM-C55.5]